MEKKSLQQIEQEKKAHKVETDRSVQQYEKTEADIRATADKVGPIESMLTDVMVRVAEAKNRILDSAQVAGDQDAKSVEGRENATAEHKRSVDLVDQQTQEEKRKADNVNPDDKRIRDGREVSQLLGDASNKLRDVSAQEAITVAEARRRRNELNARVRESISRNRR